MNGQISYFAAWLEIWDIQGYPRCHALYRAVFENELRTLFAARNGCFKGQRDRRALMDRTRVNSNAIGGCGLQETMNRLAAKWSRRMDVESRKAMYAARREANGYSTAQQKSLPTATAPIPRSKTKPKKLSPLDRKKLSVIFGALQSNLEGRQYCIELDQKRLGIPPRWSAEGCPDTYAKAYIDSSGTWQKRIQDEKSRYNEKYRQTSAVEREKLIQQAPGTRRTRH